MSPLVRSLFLLVIASVSITALHAEDGILVIQVADTEGRPIKDVVLSTRGDSSEGNPTDVAGRTRIRLAPQTRPGSWVSLQIVRAPSGRDLVFVSPWDGRASVPPFENESDNFVPVVLAERGDKAVLENPKALEALVRKVFSPPAPAPARAQAPSAEDLQASLSKVSAEYGLRPEEIDRAIRAWGRTSHDPYDKGLAELYAGDYVQASQDLTESQRLRKKELQGAEAALADADSALGQSLLFRESYREAAVAFREAGELKKSDPMSLIYLGVCLYYLGEIDESGRVFSQAFEVARKTLGPDDLETARTRNNLAAILRYQGKYSEAEQLWKQSIEITGNKLRIVVSWGFSDDPLTTALNGLAALYIDLGRTSDAEGLLEKARAFEEKVLPADGLDNATTLNLLGFLLHLRGDDGDGEELIRQGLSIRQQSRGRDSLEVAYSLDYLAKVLLWKGENLKAEELLQEAKTIEERRLGPNHPNLALTLVGLAAAYYAEGKYHDAESTAHRALAIQERGATTGNLAITVTLNALGVIDYTKARCPEAKSLLGRSLDIRQRAFPSDNQMVAESLNNLALPYIAEGNLRTAESLLKRALMIWGRVNKAEQYDSIWPLSNLGNVYRIRHKYEEAERLYKQSLQISESTYGRENIDAAWILDGMGDLYRVQHRYLEAGSLYEKARRIQEMRQGQMHPALAVSLYGLAQLYVAQRKFDEGEPLLRQSLAIREKIFGSDSLRLAQILDTYILVLRKQNRTSEAARLQTRLKEIRTRHGRYKCEY